MSKKESDMDMDSKKPTRKLKFAPKARPPKIARPLVPKTEPVEEKDDAVVTKELMEKLKTAKNDSGLGRRNLRTKKEAQVSFGAINSVSSFNIPKFSSPGESSSVEKEKEYVEPWDYESNYPITLPLRPPYSGNPENLNKEEFGDASTSLIARGTELNAATQLGLTESRDDSEMFFFQLPSVLPYTGNTSEASSSSNNNSKNAKKGCKLNELPGGGYVGKMLVYKNGKVKMKWGDALYDVNPGSDCKFAQDVVAVNQKQFAVIGQLGKRVIVTPDVDSMMDSIDDLDI
ncbi:hypothetical protein LUZ60_011013 [Juncus effusus]|nr:hypothetical protein LUZ60_011013 [Juncus effusus]